MNARSLRPVLLARSGALKRTCTVSLVSPPTFLRMAFFLGITAASWHKYRYDTSRPPRYFRKALNDASLLLAVPSEHFLAFTSHSTHCSMFLREKQSGFSEQLCIPFSASKNTIYRKSAVRLDFKVCLLDVRCIGAYSLKNIWICPAISMASFVGLLIGLPPGSVPPCCPLFFLSGYQRTPEQ